MIEHFVTINGIEVAASYSERAVKEIFLPLLEKLSALKRRKAGRILVMLAAPPGAGKSTLSSFLRRLSREQTELVPVQTIGMDGFHRRQEYLLSHDTVRDGRRMPMVEIKGAPETFDLEKLTEAVKRVAAGEICGWPAYNRLLHNPTENAETVDGDIVLLEGNYLLLDADGWRDLKQYADYTVSVAAGEELLRTRLISRRIKTGAEEEAAVRFVDFSDMPNVRLCLERTMPADLQLRLDEDGDCHMVSGEWDQEQPVRFFSADDLEDGEIRLRLRETREARPERRWLPAYYFDICLKNGEKIGNCDLRVGHNEKTRIGGNIGYGIYPPWRGHRYAAKACRLLLRLADMHRMGYVMISCDPANRASSRTCEIAGGEYLGTVPIPEDNEMYAQGKRQVMLYRFETAAVQEACCRTDSSLRCSACEL